MFEALAQASPNNKYAVEWVELDQAPFESQVTTWLARLSTSSLLSGPSKSNRRALAAEFLQVLLIYKHLLANTSEHGMQSRHARLAQRKIEAFRTKYRAVFNSELALPAPEIPGDLLKLTDDLAANAVKRDLLVRKKQLIKYWIQGTESFNPHLADVSLKLQYMGNNDMPTVRLFLDVLAKDAYRIMSMPDPRPWAVSGEVQALGGQSSSSVVWTNEDFQKAVKAEASASYGIRASGRAEIELKGLKAELNAEAFAGASVKAEGSAQWTRGQGVTAKGSVEAMIGIKITAEAKLDVADIFLVEASAEALAGALAKGEVELTANVNGVAFKLEAEAFAGARLKGSASLGIKVCGYDILKGEATGYLSAGVGAEFKMEFEASAFGGVKFGIEAGATVGVGTGGGGKFQVHADNLPRVANAIYMSAYYTILNEGLKGHAYSEYFRNLEDNVSLFRKADEIIDQMLVQCYQEHVRIFGGLRAYQQLQALSAFKTRGHISGPLPTIVAAPAPSPSVASAR